MGPESKEGRRPQPAESGNQFLILGLRLIDQDIDADRTRLHPVYRPKSAGERSPVQRGPFPQVAKYIVIVDDQGDARVGLIADPRTGVEPEIVKPSLGI